jgi:hypothetical protein
MAASAMFLGDEDQVSRTSLSNVLSDLGYPVGVAYDCPAALELSRRDAFGLALLDYRLPGMDGVELYGRPFRRAFGCNLWSESDAGVGGPGVFASAGTKRVESLPRRTRLTSSKTRQRATGPTEVARASSAARP